MKYFKPSEFACNCCKQENIDEKLVAKLDLARELAGIPFKINSAYRCPKHNANVGGVKDSSHVGGYAVDVAVPNCSSSARYKMVTAFLVSGFTRIGIYNSFIHVDIDPNKPEKVIWYGK